MELILNVLKKVKPEYREAYLRLFNECQQATLQENGCLEYALYQSFNNENDFLLFERWASKETHFQHTQTGHFKKMIDATVGFFEKSELIGSLRE
ncbi:antibiotic biosynthesis monooxygenase [Bacteroidales bacterium OttesenSCG-928-B11]|nr:antibiotic biosynthesis monooxygenase [Bacteroidales bacterium OttesenSCG-928-C03]MDL2311785.1 antibiotic biosynthesis monooxygenase [Bacteroidales bacterium OttesenSCG-928-B11]